MTYEELKLEAAKYPDTMNDLERMMGYAKGEEVDRVIVALAVCENQAPLYGYTLAQYRDSAAVQVDVARRARMDFGVGAIMANNMLGPRGVAQAFGSKVASPENSGEYITEHVVKDYSVLDSLVFDPETNPVCQKVIGIAKEIKKITEGKCPVMCGLVGPLSIASCMREPGQLLRDLKRDPENVHKLLDICVQSQLKWLEYNIKEFGQVNIMVGDPAVASELISPKMFREICKPHIQDLADGIEKIYGKRPGVSLVGKSHDIWTDYMEMGFISFMPDGFEDLEQLKKDVGHRMAISGNVPPVEVMVNGSIDDVIESVKTCLIKGSDSPCGYTLAIGGQLGYGTPKENIEAYVYAARRYGRGAKRGQPCRGLIEEGLI
ncbi:MAG: uroporphyrinogen decarboxylase [Oscillospiraceae bacterium]|nr:uroporphyrinogen decarboxylase [Oscillospiraceae bacterium]